SILVLLVQYLLNKKYHLLQNFLAIALRRKLFGLLNLCNSHPTNNLAIAQTNNLRDRLLFTLSLHYASIKYKSC
ncbi:hypothetical protein, partial [Tolypothrix sp. VBCCA 56010]|uniref:hypothetical protein n=1 Tax=Tolypothrix sp. VBCCA 56010 TaxID=3137731 RepID=UPI003D7CF885